MESQSCFKKEVTHKIIGKNQMVLKSIQGTKGWFRNITKGEGFRGRIDMWENGSLPKPKHKTRSHTVSKKSVVFLGEHFKVDHGKKK